ncbi:MAG TPA: DUF6304 family protein [Gemmata sp.]|jgi:hypothetical protein|nr:DUF6304 family protein [Gemmata sp.]
MQTNYTARYKDRVGEELTSISNDGKLLSLIVRGVQFQGRDFDSLEPTGELDPALVSSFTFQNGHLCSCVIEVGMPIPVSTPHGLVEGVLAVHLELGNPATNGGIDHEFLTLQLKVEDRITTSKGVSGWFEDEMLDIQRQLPHDTYMKACINCAFSDYFPAGHGLFGGLACFRDNKQGYLSVKTKRDLFCIWKTMTEFVQETYLCPEFERRITGAGYRG